MNLNKKRNTSIEIQQFNSENFMTNQFVDNDEGLKAKQPDKSVEYIKTIELVQNNADVEYKNTNSSILLIQNLFNQSQKKYVQQIQKLLSLIYDLY